MINLLLRVLQHHNYSRELPIYKKYSSLIYPLLVKERFPELIKSLPENFEDFIINLDEELVNETYNPSTFKHETSDFNNLSSILEILEDVTVFLTTNEKETAITIRLMILQYVHLLTLMSIRSRKTIYLKEDAQKFLRKRFSSVRLLLPRSGVLIMTPYPNGWK